MLDLNDLYLFVQVVERNGFAAASRALGIPKSSIHRRIVALEARLDARLIQRTPRQFSVTEIGREFYRHAAAMLVEAEAAENAVRARQSEPAGSVRLTCSLATSHAALLELLPRFSELHPRVRIVQYATNETTDLVGEGIDLAVRAHRGPLPSSGLIQRRLGHSPRVLVASPRYLRERAPVAAPEELAGHEGLFMTTSAKGAGWDLRGPDGQTVTVHAVPRLVANDPLALREAAQAGLGVASLPHALCRREIENRTLERVLPGWTSGGADVSLLWPHRRGQPHSVRLLIDFLAAELPSAMALQP